MATGSLLRSIGAEVQERRKQRQLTQEELAHRAGIHTNEVRRIEHGDNITIKTLHVVALMLDTPLSVLLASAEGRSESLAASL